MKLYKNDYGNRYEDRILASREVEKNATGSLQGWISRSGLNDPNGFQSYDAGLPLSSSKLISSDNSTHKRDRQLEASTLAALQKYISLNQYQQNPVSGSTAFPHLSTDDIINPDLLMKHSS